ncbi:MAG: hypothetical protein CSA65_02575 [Proteobacteria bacterium]|nr:MAG: hypothetical protein CSB49_04110 [Pseudomonadota bacterium]PIE19385.1 MAG: hypothetical protein CSA65_02575 [Pseudomonadota bacterium]
MVEGTPRLKPTGRRARWVLVGLLLITAAVYARSIGGGFIWDDHNLIVDNRYVQDWRYLRRNLESRFWDTSNTRQRWRQGHYFRPIVTLSYQLDYALWGPRAAGFHLTNVALHLLVVWLAWLLCRRLAPQRLLVAVVGAGVFALHPTRVESVVWISGRTDVLLALFVLAALLAFERALAARGSRFALWLTLGWLAWLGALGSKESAVGLALLLPALEVLFRRSPVDLSRRNWGLVHLPLVPVTAIFVVTVLTREGAAGSGALLERLWAVSAAASYYGEFILSPYEPNALVGLYLELTAASASRVLIGALTLVGGTALIVASWRRKPLAAFGLLFAGLFFAPVLNLIPVSGTAVAERFAYLPLFGLALALAVGIDSPRLAPRARQAALAGVALLACTWVAVIVIRTPDFASPLRFWQVAVAQNPRHPAAEEELAKELSRHGEFARAARYLALAQQHARERKLPAVVQALTFARMAALSDRLADAETGALRGLAGLAEGALAGERGRRIVAGERFDLTLAVMRGLRRHFVAELTQLAGTLRSRLGEDRRALALLARSIERAPRRVSAWIELGLARARAGELAAGLKALRRAGQLAPSSSRVRGLRRVLGRLIQAAPGASKEPQLARMRRFFALGVPGRAARLLESLVASRPHERSLWVGLILACAAAGDKAGVRRTLRRAREEFGAEPGLDRIVHQANERYAQLVRRLGREPQP